jgi:hypothetical protein
MRYSDSPIFIVGVHRSGTTLLRYMLNSSPRIYIPPESDFIPRFFGRDPTGSLTEARIAQLLDMIFDQYRLVKEWQGARPAAAAFLAAMPDRTPAAFLDTLYGMYAQQHGAVRWGDKTPIYASYVDLIHRIFPRAKFVHIVRDGRDVALSMLDKWGHEVHIDTYFAARNWVRRIRRAQASGSRLGPGLFYELRYEDLVQEPEAVLRPLCDFLDEPYIPDMAQPHRLGRSQIAAGDFHAQVRQPPGPSRIARWQSEMSAADLRLFQHVASDLMLELGYEPAEVGTMPPGELFRAAQLALKYATLQAGRRVLQAAGLFPPI